MFTEKNSEDQEKKIQKEIEAHVRPIIFNYSKMIPDLKIYLPNFQLDFARHLTETIQQKLLPFGQLQKQLHESLLHITKMNQSVLISFQPSFGIWAKWAEVFNGFAQQIAFLNEPEFKKFDYNWVDILDFHEKKELYEAWKKKDDELIKKILTEKFSQKELLYEILEEIIENKLYSERKDILKDAFDAHAEGKYTLAIPVLFSQIDGVFIDMHNDLDGKLTYTCPKCNEKLTAQLTAKNISENLSSVIDPLMPNLMSFTYNIFDEFRNGILHGKNTKYADRYLSTKLILIICQLYLDNEVKEIKQKKAKKIEKAQ